MTLRHFTTAAPLFVVLAASALLTGLVLTGCAVTASPHSTPATQNSAPQHPQIAVPTPAAPLSVGTSATANAATLTVYAAPGGAATSTLSNPQPSGAPLTLLVAANNGAWLQVKLAQRPNGSTGWVKTDAVTLHSLEYSLRASTEQNTLSLYKNSTLVKTFTVATGTGGTPTPHGDFYLTELLAPTNTGYGPYAFGLSAYSEVLSSFGGGPGQIGLHGTNDAASIGRAVSHGCIRLANPDITELAKLLPLGTPISIS
jgi:lipoprotein-anchoring transpeptidase ErfK/SrfK